MSKKNITDELHQLAEMDDVGFSRALAAAVIADGIKHEELDYPLSEDGIFWCTIAGLSPELVAAIAGRLYGQR